MDMAFSDDGQTGYIVGAQSAIYKSIDGTALYCMEQVFKLEKLARRLYFAYVKCV